MHELTLQCVTRRRYTHKSTAYNGLMRSCRPRISVGASGVRTVVVGHGQFQRRRRGGGDVDVVVDGRECAEELDPGPEPHDVVGRADEQCPRGRLLPAGHQAPQLPHLLPAQRCAGRARRRTPPAPAGAGPPPLLHDASSGLW